MYWGILVTIIKYQRRRREKWEMGIVKKVYNNNIIIPFTVSLVFSLDKRIIIICRGQKEKKIIKI